MTEHVAALAPDSLPVAEYTRVNIDQQAALTLAMEDPERQILFDVTFLPVGTPEDRQATAVEWAAHKQAVGDFHASQLGAVLVMNTRDESVEALLSLLEDGDEDGSGFVTSALMRVVKKTKEARMRDLIHVLYE